MVTLDHFRTGRYKPLAAVMLPVLILGLPLSYVAGAQGIPSWVPTLTIMVTGLLGSIGAYAVWGRHITYRIDHRVTEVMGRPFMDTVLDLDARKRPQIHGLARLYLTVVSPSEAQRATRLDGFLGHGRDIR